MSSIYQHFRPEEKEFIDQVIEWKYEAAQLYAPKLTDFLDPREQEIVQAVVGSQDEVQVTFFGGSEASERKRAFITPDYFQPQESDFEIALYELLYPAKFVTLEHSQILGSLMGLGLRRGKFGDILTDGRKFQVLAAKEVSSYMQLNLTRIGKISISLKGCPLSEALKEAEEWKEIRTTVSSLRLDAILSAASPLSRQKAQTLIKSGSVKVNWKKVEDTAFECSAGDIFSVRGVGRSKLIATEGKTKKDKWRIVLGILK
ncbi:YlmH family RNA-binding protein [Bacillus xiapuensis]|uniref:YlmH family RNA-binding protein n=1 Tax=Bacillus xiapuensis TaxID=2014075 RepID=UPI000C23A33D|nr:RNA-binding protein [Bacillus xiapuensis]